MSIPENIVKYPAIFLTGLVVTYCLVPLVIWLAPKLGYMDRPDVRRSHKRSTPTAGGIAVFLGFHAACAYIFLVPWTSFDGGLDASWWARFGLLSSLLLALGLADDRFPLRPW